MKKALSSLFLILIVFGVSLAKGIKAKDFALPDENGKIVKLSDLKGNVVVLIFWSTTCGTCKKELPQISVLQGEYDNKPVKFYAIVINTKDLNEIKKTKEEWGFDIPVLIGNFEVKKNYRIIGTPITYVIDKDGKIKRFFLGEVSLKRLKKAIDKALEG